MQEPQEWLCHGLLSRQTLKYSSVQLAHDGAISQLIQPAPNEG